MPAQPIRTPRGWALGRAQPLQWWRDLSQEGVAWDPVGRGLVGGAWMTSPPPVGGASGVGGDRARGTGRAGGWDQGRGGAGRQSGRFLVFASQRRVGRSSATWAEEEECSVGRSGPP